MKTSSSNSWWREMGAISRGMMFIEGSIATPAGLDPAQQETRPALRLRRSPANDAAAARRGKKGKAFSLFEDLLFLGGRPMTRGHNDDIEEPFPQTQADPAEAQLQLHRSGARRHSLAPQPQPRHCATC